MSEIKYIKKRSGQIVKWDAGKIRAAVEKAMTASGEIPERRRWLSACMVANQVELDLLDRVDNVDAVDIELVQDAVETALMKEYPKTAKAFILYRAQHKKAREAKGALNIKKLVEGYIGEKKDWRVKENSTVSESLGGLILSNSGAVTANYWLNEIYDDEIAEAHKSAAIHIHDLSMLAGYCAGWSLKQLITEGLGGVEGRITSAPASHLSTLCNQMVNFLGIMQNEWAGAQAFSSFDTYLAPFAKADGLDYKQVKQCIQSFIYGVNTPSRWGCQAPFTNVTLDWTIPDDMKNLPAIVGGKNMPFTYGDCKPEMDMINKAFLEIMIEGDYNGRGFQYPIPTYSITKNFDWSDTENNRLLFEMTAKYGTPYFSNYINSDMEPSDVRSMCPLIGTEKVLVMEGYSKVWHISTIKNLYHGNGPETYQILFNGEVKEARIHKFDGLTFKRIRLANGHEVVLSDNHLNLTMENGVKRTDELTLDDYLPFNLAPYQGSGMSFDQGFMVGAFLGDGSFKDNNSVTYSVNRLSKAAVMADIIKIGEEQFGAKVTIHDMDNNCVNVTLTSKALRGLIEDYVSGNALDKELDTKCINRSLSFREGIFAGILNTDGSPDKRRIYTASTKAVTSLCAMFASMGIPTRVSVDDRNYCIRCYNVEHSQPTYKDVYKIQDGYDWFKIASIEKDTSGATQGYCFEVLGDEEPYFMLPSGLVTHNCRLRLDLRELRKKSGGFFGSGESTGSVGVVTINMPRLAYLSSDESDFWSRLDKMMDISARSLSTKRKVITNLMEEGLYPYTKRYLGNFSNHFSTIGLVGMNEALLNANWIRKDISTQEGLEFAKRVLNHMRERLSDYQEQYGDLYNLEATPAESTSYRFAKHDKEDFPDIITAASECGSPFYTNSSHLPVSYTEDVFSALDIQDELQTLYTSGTVFHAFLGERLPSWQSAAALVRKIAENYRLPYYTMSPTYSICSEHGYLQGEHYTCPKCGKTTEVYSRITGYYRPVKNWNDGKAQEFKQRRTYDMFTSNFKNVVNNASPISMKEVPVLDEESLNSTPVIINAGEEFEKETELRSSGKFLITSKECPNCAIAKQLLADAGINDINIVLAEDVAQICKDYKIRSAPTLLLINPDGTFDKISGVSQITGWIQENN